jgi:hypothetical protein
MIRQSWTINEDERKRILNLHENATKGYYILKEVTDPNKISFNINKSFPSGKYIISDTSEIDNAISQIQSLLKSGKGNFNTIVINSSESKVPNQGVGLDSGVLSQKRGEEVMKYIKSKIGDSTNIQLNNLGPQGPEWDKNKGSKHPDYTKYQYVTLTLSAEKCNFNIDYEGIQGLPKNNFIAILPPPYTNVLSGKGKLSFYTGTMPDRLIITDTQKQVTQDTGYVSTELYLDDKINYIPAWVDSLTKNYNQKSPSVSGSKLITKTISSIDELVSLIFKDEKIKIILLDLINKKSFNGIKSKLTGYAGTGEVSIGFVNLLNQFNSGVREFVLYEKRTSPYEIVYDTSKGDNLFFVYAPIGGKGMGSTGFNIKGSCI